MVGDLHPLVERVCDGRRTAGRLLRLRLFEELAGVLYGFLFGFADLTVEIDLLFRDGVDARVDLRAVPFSSQ